MCGLANPPPLYSIKMRDKLGKFIEGKDKDRGGFKKGHIPTKEMKEKQGKTRKERIANGEISFKIGSENPSWKGNNAGIAAIHKWLKSHCKKPEKCERCSKVTIKLDLSNNSGLYKRDLNDYEWLCRSCHMKKDAN